MEENALFFHALESTSDISREQVMSNINADRVSGGTLCFMVPFLSYVVCSASLTKLVDKDCIVEIDRQSTEMDISDEQAANEQRCIGGCDVSNHEHRDGDGKLVLNGQARKKKSLGQYFTEGTCWLQPQVIEFIRNSKCRMAYDPFAGSGCLFGPVTNAVSNIKEIAGLDIDPSLGWEVNDSLLNIPRKRGAIIITNPPYISNYSASRKRIDGDLKKYFDVTEYDDVYLLALERMLDAQNNVVAIIPETFINSPFKKKDYLSSITILEENPFADTDTPVVVACFDSIRKSFDEIKVYKGRMYVCTLGDVDRCRLTPNNSVKMRFNDIDGWLGVRCVDTTDPMDMLRFDFKENIDYDWGKGIKVSSRLLTLISIEVPKSKRKTFVASCNEILQGLRERSHDIILSPFKGNMKNGVRRRRLDFQTCRAIIEQAYYLLFPECVQNNAVQQYMFEEDKR